MVNLKVIHRYIIIVFICLNSYSSDSLNTIEVGGIYRMVLTTGDVLEGIVEEKKDSIIIIESRGTPYKFVKYIIKSFSVLSPPKIKNVKKAGNSFDDETILFEELLHRSNAAKNVRINIKNGSVFEGLITEIDSLTIKLDIEGSVVPISKSIITKISLAVPKGKKSISTTNSSKTEETKGPLDTIFISTEPGDKDQRNSPPTTIIGTIQSDVQNGITLLLREGTLQHISRDKIVRVIRHSKPSYEHKIKKYAKSLLCQPNMILVDIPPGKEDRPFFKVCIDKYEFPNIKGTTPVSNISFNDASAECEKIGKRLCTVDEWEWACGGLEKYPYSYGFLLEEDYCNRNGIKNIEPSGSRNKCVGKFGVYDMVGNIFEWVIGAHGEKMVMGGPLSKCQKKSPGMSGIAKPQVGFRCCKSN